MTWDPGRARHRVTFQSATRTGDGRGGSSKAWADVAALAGVWVELKPLRSMERLRAMQLATEPTHEVRTWYSSATSSNSSHAS
jgi:SPP1 family predicted phage head-tail adaptor